MRTRFLYYVLLGALGCGPGARRDLASVPLRQITYDDMCGLQDHFDQRATAHAGAFRAANEQSTETSREEPDEHGRPRRVVLGDGTYLIAERSDRARLRQLLREEFRRLPELHILRRGADVRVHLGWVQTGALRRARSDVPMEVIVDGEATELPAHPCVGEFLFGDEAYTMRRNIMAAERARAHGEIPAAYLHAEDAGVAGDAEATSAATTPPAPAAPTAPGAAPGAAPGPSAPSPQTVNATGG
ncbi:MAG: hypothetical protein HY909_12790 [Deltaproteobacteria bacterium]|nr:hypothetical protein [Deltaproteobacteria bacterium]